MDECMRKTLKKPISGRWVDVNKGDDQMEVYRSRYVEMELKHQYRGATRDGLFAAMMRLFLLYVASRQNRKFPHKLMFIDISKAYLHADVLNDSIYFELPEKMNMPNVRGRLLRALYGTRQPARAWEDFTKTLKGVDFPEGEVQPVHVLSSRRDVRVLVHGDGSQATDQCRNPVRSGSESCRLDHRRTGTRECEWVRCDWQQSGCQRDRHRVGP